MRRSIAWAVSLFVLVAAGCGGSGAETAAGGAGGTGGSVHGGGGAGGQGGVACEDPPEEPASTPFTRVAETDLDPLTDRLCDESAMAPADVPNPWDIHCKTTSGRGAKIGTTRPKALKIVEWNIERGMELDGVKDKFLHDAVISDADVVLLAEVDRGCPRSGNVEVARELGEALGMDWAFGVEFIEGDQGGCEEGNAILSRYPLGNVESRFHDVGSLSRGKLHAPYDWFEDADEPRLGRREFLGADLEVEGGLLRVVAAHLENRSTAEERGGEAGEIVDRIGALPRLRAIVAGDLNVFPDIGTTVVDAPLFDLMEKACFVNPHADLPQEKRRTRPSLAYQIDFVYVRAATVGKHGVDNADPSPPSDHWPVWVDLAFP